MAESAILTSENIGRLRSAKVLSVSKLLRIDDTHLVTCFQYKLFFFAINSLTKGLPASHLLFIPRAEKNDPNHNTGASIRATQIRLVVRRPREKLREFRISQDAWRSGVPADRFVFGLFSRAPRAPDHIFIHTFVSISRSRKTAARQDFAGE